LGNQLSQNTLLIDLKMQTIVNDGEDLKIRWNVQKKKYYLHNDAKASYDSSDYRSSWCTCSDLYNHYFLLAISCTGRILACSIGNCSEPG